MTDKRTYTSEQALARRVLLTAVKGGITHRARTHGFSVGCEPEQVRAEGVETVDDHSLRHADFDHIQHRITKLIEHPAQCAAPGRRPDLHPARLQEYPPRATHRLGRQRPVRETREQAGRA